MQSAVPNGLVRFGVFEADPRSGELRKNGLRLKVQEQPFQVLMALVRRPGEVVTREELRQQLWPSDTFVDFDHGLNTAINKLRDALNDKASNPRFIETLPRRGYRFIAPVHCVAVADEAAVDSASTTAISNAESGTAVVSAPMQPAATGDARSDLPHPRRGLTRTLFALLQTMYLVFYVLALVRWEQVHNIVPAPYALPVMVAIMLTAPIGIALRLYLLTAVCFDYLPLGANFLRLFPFVFALDLLWALSPFLLVPQIGIGGALAACAALLYLPFSQRTLIQMSYARS